MARTSAKKNRGLALKEGSLASKADLEAVEERWRRGWWQQAYAVGGSEPYRALVAFLGDVRCVRQALALGLVNLNPLQTLHKTVTLHITLNPKLQYLD